MNLTDLEKLVLPQLVEQYADGTISEEPHFVDFCTLTLPTITARQFSGVMSSLNRKGLIVSTGGSGVHEVRITRQAIEIL